MGTVSGPMFERARSGPWESLHRKDGAHYNTYACHDVDGMDAIREMFPDGQADEFNVCLFSTSGVHGTYATIEEVEAWVLSGIPYDCLEEGEEPGGFESVTFLILHPGIVCTRHGNCQPKTPEDFALLKRLRETSWEALTTIGRPPRGAAAMGEMTDYQINRRLAEIAGIPVGWPRDRSAVKTASGPDWSPLTSWDQLGPLMERFDVTSGRDEDAPELWYAQADSNTPHCASFDPDLKRAVCLAIIAAHEDGREEG